MAGHHGHAREGTHVTVLVGTWSISWCLVLAQNRCRVREAGPPCEGDRFAWPGRGPNAAQGSNLGHDGRQNYRGDGGYAWAGRIGWPLLGGDSHFGDWR